MIRASGTAAEAVIRLLRSKPSNTIERLKPVPWYIFAEKCVDKYGLVGPPGLNSGLLFSDQRQQQHCKKLDQHRYQLSTEQQEARPAIHKTRPHPHRRIGDSSIRQNRLKFYGYKTIDKANKKFWVITRQALFSLNHPPAGEHPEPGRHAHHAATLAPAGPAETTQLRHPAGRWLLRANPEAARDAPEAGRPRRRGR